jgi:hypothetical protein
LQEVCLRPNLAHMKAYNAYFHLDALWPTGIKVITESQWSWLSQQAAAETSKCLGGCLAVLQTATVVQVTYRTI